MSSLFPGNFTCLKTAIALSFAEMQLSLG